MSGADPFPPDPRPPPKLSAKVIGFRSWLLGENYKLLSGAGAWSFEVNTAECRRDIFENVPTVLEGLPMPTHEAPDHACTCGLYAWYTVGPWEGSGLPGNAAFGAIAAWGHIEAQPAGFRSQYAQPVLLAYHEEQAYKHVRDLKAIASEMGVECVPLEELPEAARAYGEPIPEELRPGMTMRHATVAVMASMASSSRAAAQALQSFRIAPAATTAPRRGSKAALAVGFLWLLVGVAEPIMWGAQYLVATFVMAVIFAFNLRCYLKPRRR